MCTISFAFVFFAFVISAGCGQAEISDRWRIHSETAFWDAGGSTVLDTPVTTELALGAGGDWHFASSSGRWSIQEIDATDWERWGIDAYGPTRRLVLDGWGGDSADGPIEDDETGDAEGLWVIYRVTDPMSGTVWMNFIRP